MMIDTEFDTIKDCFNMFMDKFPNYDQNNNNNNDFLVLNIDKIYRRTNNVFMEYILNTDNNINDKKYTGIVNAYNHLINLIKDYKKKKEKKNVKDDFNKMYNEIKEMYNEIKKETPNIDIPRTTGLSYSNIAQPRNSIRSTFNFSNPTIPRNFIGNMRYGN